MARFRELAEGSLQCIFVFDHDNRVLFANRAAAKTFGSDSIEEIMAAEPLASFIAPHERARIKRYRKDRMAGRPVPNIYEFEGVRKDGSPIWLENTARVIEWEGKPANQATMIDITERKRAEAALREKDQQFAEVQAELFHVSRVSAVGQLSSALAHELNQPLAAIMNYVQLARDLAVAAKGQTNPKLTDFMDKAVDQAERAAKVITRLRAFFEKGELARRKEPLNEVLEEAVSLALLDRKDFDLKVRLELARSLPAVDIDKIQIQQVTLNLIRNAVEAMESSERREILIRTRRANATVRVEVRDTGPGLSEEVRSQMFEPFVTTRSKGMGLGLSIAKSIIDAHGGRLSARSVKGKGTTFAFDLPISPPEGGRR